MILYFILLFLGFQFCSGVIYHLNDSEHERMPALFALDNYDSCISKEKGVYCTAEVQLLTDTPNDVMTLIEEYSAHVYKHYNHSLIARGVCVTKICQNFIKNHDVDKEEDLKHVLEECINNTIWNEYGLQAKLLDHYCDKQHEEAQKDIYDYLMLFLIYGLLLLNIGGTVCDFIVHRLNLEKNGSQGMKHYLMCFSIIQNWNWLVSADPEDPRRRKLKGLYGLKCIVLVLFIIGHVFYMFHAFTENPHTFEKYYEYLWYKLLFNGMVCVQMLFCISGFLLMYQLLLESEKREITWSTVPQVIILRIWRLTPANAFYVLFSATLFRNWGSGPLWKWLITSKMSGDCRRYWWSHLLFINNYIPDDRFCVVQNWQLAAIFQLFIVGLCVFVATKTHKRQLVLSSFVLLGIALKAVHIYWNDLDAFMMLNPQIYRTFDSPNYVVHKFGHVNLPAFFIGMLTGHIVYKLQKENVDVLKYKAILNPLCHLVIPSIVLLFYSESFFYADAERASLFVRILYGSVLVPAMALITSFIIFAMVFRITDFWVNFLEWNGWVLPGRLSYSISLIHTFFIIDIFGSRTQLLHVSSLNHAVMYLGIGALSFFFAIPYCLMVEAPFNKLAKSIMSKTVQHMKKVE